MSNRDIWATRFFEILLRKKGLPLKSKSFVVFLMMNRWTLCGRLHAALQASSARRRGVNGTLVSMRRGCINPSSSLLFLQNSHTHTHTLWSILSLFYDQWDTPNKRALCSLRQEVSIGFICGRMWNVWFAHNCSCLSCRMTKALKDKFT